MAARNNEYVKRRWQSLIEERGGKCQECGSSGDLEFAHLQPTKCKGMGRGKSRRLADILKHPGKYRLLCMPCHDALDGRARRKRQPDIRKFLPALKECVNCGDTKEAAGFDYCGECNEDLCADCLSDDHQCTESE
jgi:5-methylcytosine-specific restriction endonuclease McrA